MPDWSVVDGLPLVSIERCSVCGGTDLAPLSLGDHPLQRCRSCRAVVSARIGDPAAVYDDSYHTGESGMFIDTDLPGFRDYLQRVNRERVALLGPVSRPPGRLLDIGCGRGDLLVAAREAGWQVLGVEMVAAAAAVARERHGLDVRTGTLVDAGIPPGSLDVVTGTHLLEHMVDTVEFLGQVRALLRPGGRVFVEVPNWRHPLRVRERGEWRHLHPYEHVTHFTAPTLRAALRRGGFRVELLRSPTWIGTPQTIDRALFDLGLAPWTRLVHRLPRGQWRLARAAQALMDRTRTGVVLVAVGRAVA